jgi:CheY-like chemotaxis protein
MAVWRVIAGADGLSVVCSLFRKPGIIKHRMRVVVAHSDSGTRAGWKTDLKEIGVAGENVVEAPDLQTLFRALTDGSEVSLVMIPWIFSAMNGFTLLGEIRQRRGGPTTPVLAMGGPHEVASMEACAKVGLTAFIVQPAKTVDVRRKISRLLFGETSASRKVLREIVTTAAAELELPFFVQLPSNMMLDFLRLSVAGNYPKGATLIKAGKSVKALHVLTLGQAEIQDGSSAPRVLDMGDCFGELPFLTEEHNTATVTTTGPVEVHSLDRSGLAELVRLHPGMSKFLSALVSRRKRIPSGRSFSSPSSGMGGSLGSMPFPDLIQMLHSTRKSGVLTVEDGERKAGVVFDDGNVIHAWSERAAGVDAFNRIAGWKKGLFYFRAEGRASHPTTITGGTLPLLMEAMRVIDEADRGP